MILFLFIVSWIQGSYGEICTKYDSNGFSTSFYCSDSCCGTIYDRYCCYNDLNWDPTGVIVGSVIGGLVLLGILITVFVYICTHKMKATSGIVVPSTGPTVIMAHSHHQTGGYVYPPIQPYPYGTSQNIMSTDANPTPSGSGRPVVPPPYPGASGGAYPASSGDNLHQ